MDLVCAGSLAGLLSDDVAPAFERSSGVQCAIQNGGSVALAEAIGDGSRTPDVFLPADASVNALLMPPYGNAVRWFVLFARTTRVVAYCPTSPWAAELARAAAGQVPWYEVLSRPGLKLGRSDPNLDPGGYFTVMLFELAERFYGRPGLRREVLGEDTNPAQVLPTPILRSGLETGELDAMVVYRNTAVERGLPYIELPPELNFGDPNQRGWYAQATFTTTMGRTFRGVPVYYSATIPRGAREPEAAASFIEFLLSNEAQEAMRRRGYLQTPALVGGDERELPASLRTHVAGLYSPP